MGTRARVPGPEGPLRRASRYGTDFAFPSLCEDGRRVHPKGCRAVARKDFQRLKVLVVDGSEHMRVVLRRHLYALTIGNVREAATGQEGVKLLGDFHPDLVIWDLDSAPLGGLELVARVRAGIDGVDPLVPVITVTGAIDVAEMRALCEAGADAVLPKPILLRRLYLAVVDALDRSHGACPPAHGRGQGVETQ